jgi:hypothetical protein
MSVAPPPATYTATNDLNALKNIFVPQYQFSNGYYHAIVNTQLPGNVAVGTAGTSFLLTVNGAPTMTLSDLQNWSYYRATSNLVMNSNSITTVSKLTFVGGNTTNAFTIDAPNGFINVSAYYLRGNFINLSGGLTAWASYPASTNVNMSGYSIASAASVSLSSGGSITNPASNVVGFSNAAFGETMRITQSGQLSVGTSAQFPGFSLVVNGSSQFKSSIVMTTSAYTSSSNSFFVNAIPSTVGNADIQVGALGGNTNMYFCTGGVVNQRLKLDSNGNFTVMTGTLTTTDSTKPHSVGGIIFQNQDISASSLTINGVPYNGGVAAGVASVNSLCGTITLTAGTNISLYTSGNSIVIGVSGSTGGSSGVTTLNTLSGAVTLIAGTSISLYRTGNNIVIGVSGGSTGGVTTLNTLSGALTLVAGSNISLSSTGSGNIRIETGYPGVYGGVTLSGYIVTASALITTGVLASKVGGVTLQGNFISASGVYTSPDSYQSVIGGVTLENSLITADSINLSNNISMGGTVSISGLTVDSIVSTVNGIAGSVTISGGTNITAVRRNSMTIGIDATPPNVIMLDGTSGSNVNLATAVLGTIYVLPRDLSPDNSVWPIDFPESGTLGTYWKIKNSALIAVSFTYSPERAILPDLDPTSLGTFNLDVGGAITLVCTNANTNQYYNVN